MSFLNDINKLLGNDNPLAQQLGLKIKAINDSLESKEITADEAKDLLNDMDVETQLIQLANDLEAKILVQQSIQALISIIENIPGI